MQCFFPRAAEDRCGFMSTPCTYVQRTGGGSFGAAECGDTGSRSMLCVRDSARRSEIARGDEASSHVMHEGALVIG